MHPLADANLTARAVIILGLVLFGFYIAADRGALTLALTSDKSYISYLILGIYVLASGHWLMLAHALNRERREFAALERHLDGTAASDGTEVVADASLIGRFAASRKNAEGGDLTALLTAFADELANRHALGHFISDALLKLGLLGTVVGFILMLMPIGEITEFDPGLMQRLLTEMSGGMAVALYTTLAGLVTSTLLKLQYHILDASAAELATRLSVVTADHAP